MELFYKFSRIWKVGVRFNGPKNVTKNYTSVIFKSYTLYSTVITSWSGYLREHNDYPTILLNSNWITKPSLIIDNEGLHVQMKAKKYCAKFVMVQWFNGSMPQWFYRS